MEWHSIKDQSRDRLDARPFRLGNLIFCFAQMNDFDGIFCLVERKGNLLFSLYANRTTRMVEYRFIHCVLSFLLLFLSCRLIRNDA